jgi:hypothetical protein
LLAGEIGVWTAIYFAYFATKWCQIRICASVIAGAATSVIAGADPQSINSIEQAKLNTFRQSLYAK